MRKRMSNMELLRDVSMFMIVLLHLMGKTSAITDIEPGRPVYYAAWILSAICRIGNNGFVLISGYFAKESKFRLEKLLHLYVQVLFYSVTLAALMKFLHVDLTSRLSAIVFPVTHAEYWFATVYIGLYCLMPGLNIILEHAEKRKLEELLIVLGILFSVIPTFFHASGWLGDGGAYSIVWFCFLYLLGAYIRQYGQAVLEKSNMKTKIGLCFLGSILIVPLSKFVIVLLGRGRFSEDFVTKASEILYPSNSVPVLCASVLLLLIFCSVKIENAKLSNIINLTGGVTFGIYLIHNNRNFAHYLWEKCRIHYWLAERGNLLVVIGIGLGVFIACGLIEWIRQQMFKMLRIDKLIDKVAMVLQKAVCIVCKNDQGGSFS